MNLENGELDSYICYLHFQSLKVGEIQQHYCNCITIARLKKVSDSFGLKLKFDSTD